MSDSKTRVLITDYSFADLEPEKRVLQEAGLHLEVAQCKSAEDVCRRGAGASALLVQAVSITREVLEALPECKLVVRYGVGVDNVDVEAAKARGVAVCNVPDYGIDEVADHALALALSLGRQLPALDRRLREGVWKMVPITPMRAFHEMTFVTAGLGRIGREVLQRARGFKFDLAAYDPFVPDEAFAQCGVRRVSLDEMFAQADILSLHLPLTPETHHLVNAARLKQMKPHAILVNTARGALIDTLALAQSLEDKAIAYAGLDVFEDEPLPSDHPLRGQSNALLSSHMAWCSESSVPRLQRLAAEEVVRGLSGQTLRNQVNR